MRVCNEVAESGGGSIDDFAFIRAILQDVIVDAMVEVILRYTFLVVTPDYLSLRAITFMVTLYSCYCFL